MIRFVFALLLFFASAGSGQAALIGHWTLDSTLEDAAGANDLTYGGGGTPSYVAGQFSNAGALGGSNWYDTGVTEIGTTSLFAEAAQSWSVSAWFNVTNGNEGTIVGKAGETERTLQIFLQGGTINTHIRGGVSETVATFDDGQWHHVVVTWNGSAGVLYVDNAVSIASLTIGNNAEQTTENIIIGGRTGGTGFLLTGSIDDVRIFNHALSAGEVDELFDPSEPPPAGDFDIDVTREPIRTGTGTQDFEFANFDQDCTSVSCLVMLILTSATVDGSAAAHANIGVGFTNGTSETAISVYAEDGVATTDTDRANRDNGEAIFLFSEGADDGVADFSAWLSDGIRINVTDAFTAQYLVTAIIFGGSDFQSAMGNAALGTVDTPTDVNTVGFEPDLVFLFGTRIASAGDLNSTSQFFNFGFAVNDGASTQGGIACDATDAAAESESWVVTSSQYALPSTNMSSSGLGPSGEVGGWDASGFSITTRVSTTSSDTKWVAIDFGDLNSAVVDIDAPTSTGAQAISVGFQSQFGMILGTLAKAYDTVEGASADPDADACMIGVATENTEFANEMINDDGQSTTNTASGSNDTFVLINPGDQSCNAGSCYVATLSSFDSTNWNLDYTSVFNDAVRKWVGLAIEGGTAPPTLSGRRRISVWGAQ